MSIRTINILYCDACNTQHWRRDEDLQIVIHEAYDDGWEETPEGLICRYCFKTPGVLSSDAPLVELQEGIADDE